MRADDPRHGTANGYNNLGCRCEACRDAIATYSRERRYSYDLCGCGREKSKNADFCHACYLAGVVNVERHGSDYGYSRGCRCQLCREAHRQARARRRARAAA